jgi:hypothetical protein
MTIEVMKQALEALEEWATWTDHPPPKTTDTIAALRTAIEQAEKQEPIKTGALSLEQLLRVAVDWGAHNAKGDYFDVLEGKIDQWVGFFSGTTSPAAPVQGLQRYSPNGEGGMEVDSLGAYVKHQDVTTPPAAQRQWVGLTNEEVKHQWEAWRASLPRYAGFAKGIEAKLKEKNA